MPFRLEDIETYGVPISFLKKGEVEARVGPCSSSIMGSQKIPLDGRHYICAGVIILKNGMQLQGNFEINTHTFDFLERDSVMTYIEKEKAWYYFNEEELYDLLGVTREEALPYTWLPDRPLDYHIPGPYPMKWPEE
jgi:hypothetical protein